MENSKLLTLYSILTITLFLLSCNRDNKVNSVKQEANNKNTEKSDLLENNLQIDSTDFILKNISVILTERELKHSISERNYGDTIHQYTYILLSLNKAELNLVKQTFDSEQKAQASIWEDQVLKNKLKNEKQLDKIINFSFRKDNIIYRINSSENISHIRSQIFDWLIKYFNIKEQDIVLL